MTDRAREAAARASINALRSMQHLSDHEFEDQLIDTHKFELTAEGQIALTLTMNQDEESALPESLCLVLLLEDTYRAQAAFRNSETGRTEPHPVYPEEQPTLHAHAQRAGHQIVRIYEMLRTHSESTGPLSDVDDTTLRILLMGNLRHATEISEEVTKRADEFGKNRLEAPSKCLATAQSILEDARKDE